MSDDTGPQRPPVNPFATVQARRDAIRVIENLKQDARLRGSVLLRYIGELDSIIAKIKA